MKQTKNYHLIFISLRLFGLGVLIEWKRKKLNRLIQQGCLLSSKDVRKANQNLSPLILKWQILEESYMKQAALLKPLPVEK